ncbi:MAG TPA: hypothetical protein VK705_11415 [Ferruginibacter sp.]|jgi:hypothetical protein|nr:hypothetical protein [Ferruginibacter sp.]
MFTFVLQENKTDIEIVITRILLAVAGIATLLYGGTYYLINISTAVVLIAISYFVNRVSTRFEISRSTVLIISAIILFIGTHSFIFTGTLLCYAFLLKFLQKKPEIIITVDNVLLRKVFKDEFFEWQQFNNIILKDGLLTLDFADNKLLQLIVDEDETEVDEKDFNAFCHNQFDLINK